MSSTQPFTGFAEFLAKGGPGATLAVTQLIGSDYNFRLPDISAHCSSEKCGGIRQFAFTRELAASFDSARRGHTISFACRNCNLTKIWISMLVDTKGDTSTITMLGAWPTDLGPTPPSLISITGMDRSDFLKGRKCESQGLGVAAFSYYRRVVERQKHRLFAEIIRTLEAVGGHEQLIEELRKASAETQFTKSFAAIRIAMPDSLKINGHNPLLILHDALSEGMHSLSDAECLEYAEVCRSTLSALCERLRLLREQNAEVGTAITKLLNRKTQSKPS